MVAESPGDAAQEFAAALEPVPMEPVAPPERRTRAGRNLYAAIGVGLGLAALVIGSLYIYKPSFVAVVAIAVVLGVWEMANALGESGVHPPVVPMAVGGVAILVAAYVGGTEAMLVALALTVLATMAWRLTDGDPQGYVADVSAGIFVTFYVACLAGFAMLMLRADDGADRVLIFILLTALSDVGGYASGVFLGRHPMAPTVSPKKSWEGFGGSALFCAVGGAIAIPVLLSDSPLDGALIGLVVLVTATVGDLGESMIKRDLGLKDMGRLLPGHGGIMDRLDSLLPTAPAVFLLLTWLVPPR